MDKSDSHKNLKRLVAHFEQRFEKAYHEALQDLNSYPPDKRALFDPSALAMLMHVHVRHRMKLNFTGVLGADPVQKKGRAFCIKLDGAAIGIPEVAEFKCKKINHRLLTANIPTLAVKAFNNQRPAVQPSLGDWVSPKTLKEPSHGNAGYIPNPLWTGFERLCVTYPTGMHSAQLVLELSAEAPAAPVINLPVGEIKEIQPRKRVKAREQKKDAAQSDGKAKKRLKLVSTDNGSKEEKTKKRARNNGADS